MGPYLRNHLAGRRSVPVRGGLAVRVNARGAVGRAAAEEPGRGAGVVGALDCHVAEDRRAGISLHRQRTGVVADLSRLGHGRRRGAAVRVHAGAVARVGLDQFAVRRGAAVPAAVRALEPQILGVELPGLAVRAVRIPPLTFTQGLAGPGIVVAVLAARQILVQAIGVIAAADVALVVQARADAVAGEALEVLDVVDAAAVLVDQTEGIPGEAVIGVGLAELPVPALGLADHMIFRHQPGILRVELARLGPIVLVGARAAQVVLLRDAGVLDAVVHVGGVDLLARRNLLAPVADHPRFQDEAFVVTAGPVAGAVGADSLLLEAGPQAVVEIIRRIAVVPEIRTHALHGRGLVLQAVGIVPLFAFREVDAGVLINTRGLRAVRARGDRIAVGVPAASDVAVGDVTVAIAVAGVAPLPGLAHAMGCGVAVVRPSGRGGAGLANLGSRLCDHSAGHWLEEARILMVVVNAVQARITVLDRCAAAIPLLRDAAQGTRAAAGTVDADVAV